MRGHRKYTLPGKLLEGIRQEIFPERCPGCNEILFAKEKEKGFCQACAGKIIYIGDGGCVKCGKALTDLTQDLCGDCGKKAHAFVQNRAVYAYDGPMKEAMYRFKYSNCRAYRRIFAKDAWRIYGDWLRNLEVDAVVPVPMYAGKERQRGYNQAEVFAGEIATLMDCRMERSLAVRTKNTAPLKNLNDQRRKKNLENAFKIRKNGVKLNKILLIDDIYTTGSTLDGVTEALLASGVRQVYCLTVCAGREKHV